MVEGGQVVHVVVEPVPGSDLNLIVSGVIALVYEEHGLVVVIKETLQCSGAHFHFTPPKNKCGFGITAHFHGPRRGLHVLPDRVYVDKVDVHRHPVHRPLLLLARRSHEAAVVVEGNLLVRQHIRRREQARRVRQEDEVERPAAGVGVE